MQSPASNGRPYRSHLRPACLPCRRRKSRCQSEASSDVCLMCRAHCTDCVFPSGPNGGINPESARRRRQTRYSSGNGTTVRRGISEHISGSDVTLPRSSEPNLNSASSNDPSPNGSNPESRPAERPAPPQAAPEEESPLALGSVDDQQHNLHIVGPAAASDNQVLSNYLSSKHGATRGARSIIPVPGNQSKPVLFTRVQKRPLGLSANRSFSAQKLEIIERLLEPFENDVLDLYFQLVNRRFPLVDEASFRRQLQENKDGISPALISSLYANSLTYWNISAKLSKHRCPDTRFIWNLANEATYSELHLSPSTSIIQAILLNVGGRPTTSLTGNGVLLGSAVALAYSFGLHHNPMQWEISEPEKNLRMKIWWALWINDKWSSLAHGTPPHISGTHFNVPKPTLDCFPQSGSLLGDLTSLIFIALVGLTDVLDLYLCHIYQFDAGEPSKTTHLELALNSWVEGLNHNIRKIPINGDNQELPGGLNLRFAYLTIRLLLVRIQLEEERKLYDPDDDRLRNRYIQARRACEDILYFTQDLLPIHLGEFWLPSSAFSFAATVSFLLRCTIENDNSIPRLEESIPLGIAENLISSLRSHKEEHGWDLGDICLAQHAETVHDLMTMVPPNECDLNDPLDLQDYMPDVSGIDQFFPSIWDTSQNLVSTCMEVVAWDSIEPVIMGRED